MPSVASEGSAVDEMGKKITETIEKPVVGFFSRLFGGGT
jgi:hypothetical protein